MVKREVTYESMEALLYGSLILGAGGGGSLKDGRETIAAAFEAGTPTIIDVTDFENKDGIVVTTSAVGAPSAKDQFVKPADYNRVVELLEKELDRPLVAYLTNELGGGSTFNAFIQSATTGIPMLDAACNGRAHPLGTMGSMGLSEDEDYVSIQTAVGGNPANNNYVEIVTKGSVQKTSALVRAAAVQAGGVVVVARNPVSLEYVSENAALGVLTQAEKVGTAFLTGLTPEEKLANVAEELNGTVLFEGAIDNFEFVTEGGLDVGSFTVKNQESVFKMSIWNEYMTCDKDGKRIATFPDLLMTFDVDTGEPVTSAKIQEGQSIRVLFVPQKQLHLGAGMFERSGYERIEEVLDIKTVPYVTDVIREV